MSKQLSYGPKVSQNTLRYWESVLRLVDAAGSFAFKEKLLENLRDKNTSFKVEPVVEKYYGGSEVLLSRRIYDAQKWFNDCVMELNLECEKNSLRGVAAPTRLLHLLYSKDRRGYYKREAKKLLAKNEVISLQDLEERFTRYRQRQKERGNN